MSSLRTFYDRFPVKKFRKGEVILQQGEVPKSGFAIKRGVIKITDVSTDGSEKIISFKITNDIFPICWMFSKTTASLFYYQAHTDCEIYFFDKENIMNALAVNREFANSLLDRQISAFVSDSLQIDALVQSRATIKLLYTFRHLCLRFGRRLDGSLTRIQVPLTQSELANLTGLTRETTVIELNKLKQKEIISSRHRYYTVDTDQLNTLIDGGYNPKAVTLT